MKTLTNFRQMEGKLVSHKNSYFVVERVDVMMDSIVKITFKKSSYLANIEDLKSLIQQNIVEFDHKIVRIESFGRKTFIAKLKQHPIQIRN